jgi:hypothetical protein
VDGPGIWGNPILVGGCLWFVLELSSEIYEAISGL